MAITRQSHGNHGTYQRVDAKLDWQSHGNHMAITRQSRHVPAGGCPARRGAPWRGSPTRARRGHVSCAPSVGVHGGGRV
eukprot:4520541-Prymnesium_polylepis.1